VDLLCELKDQEPELSLPLTLSTVHRLLSRKGLMAKRKDYATSKDRRRFEYDEANELWMKAT
jgi:hypothetical protein